jgi:broad specificity phosphatase PhoE
MAVVQLIRHGQASFGAAEYDELSDLGRKQSRTLGAALAARGQRFDRVLSGSMRRQRDTAKLALDPANLEIDDRWNEYDHLGLVQHQVPEDVRSFQELLDGALERWIRGETPQGVLPWADFSGRVWSALDDVLAKGGSTAVFTSGGAIMAVCARLLELTPAGCVTLHRVVVNGGITKLISGRRGTSLISFNEHSCFEAAPDQLTYR